MLYRVAELANQVSPPTTTHEISITTGTFGLVRFMQMVGGKTILLITVNGYSDCRYAEEFNLI